MKDLLTAEGLVAHMEKKGITFNRIPWKGFVKATIY